MLRSFILVVVFIQVLTAFVSVSCSLIACEVAAMMMNDSVEVILQCCFAMIIALLIVQSFLILRHQRCTPVY